MKLVNTLTDFLLIAVFAAVFVTFCGALYIFGGKDARRELSGSSDEDAL